MDDTAGTGGTIESLHLLNSGGRGEGGGQGGKSAARRQDEKQRKPVIYAHRLELRLEAGCSQFQSQ